MLSWQPTEPTDQAELTDHKKVSPETQILESPSDQSLTHFLATTHVILGHKQNRIDAVKRVVLLGRFKL